jgi:hypothetical protein
MSGGTARNNAVLAVILGVTMAASSGGVAAIDNNERPAITTAAASATLHGRHGSAGPADASISCGIERWDVKTGTDPAATNVDQTGVHPTTIAQLDALKPPVNPTSRVAPVEDSVYQITATLTAYKIEADSDYHLALADDAKRTMIAEIPAPNCISTGPFKSPVTQARRTFDAVLQPTASYQTANMKVVITGVGFFDRIHGQRGVAPNGIELHPVLAISFDH